VRGDRKDVQRLVDQFKANPDNRPTNLLQNYLELSPLRGDEEYLEAKDYNALFNEDKRLKVQFIIPSMLTEKRSVNGNSVPFFTALEHERLQTAGVTNGYEGVAVYVFCENENDIDAAKKSVAQNNQQRVMVAIPRNPINVYDAIFTLKALESDWFKKQSQSFSPYEKRKRRKFVTRLPKPWQTLKRIILAMQKYIGLV